MNRRRKGMLVKGLLVFALGVVIVLGVLGGSGGINFQSTVQNAQTGDKGSVSSAPVPCVDPTKLVPEQYRIYPHLTIIVDGSVVAIPANIGIGPDCTHAMYTKDASGTIHIEPAEPRTYSLGNFFQLWGQPFSSAQVLGYRADADHSLTMTVNGVSNSQFQDLSLADKQDIVIVYRTLRAPAVEAPPITVTIPPQ